MTYRLLVCSYKCWYDPEFFAEQMKSAAALHGEICLVHRGGSWGAELIAREWAKHPGFSQDVFEKDVRKFGYQRDIELNERMISSGVDEIHVYITSTISKTRPMYKIEPDLMVLAELYDIPVKKFEMSRRKNGNGRQYKLGALGGRSSEKPAPRAGRNRTGKREPRGGSDSGQGGA